MRIFGLWIRNLINDLIAKGTYLDEQLCEAINGVLPIHPQILPSVPDEWISDGLQASFMPPQLVLRYAHVEKQIILSTYVDEMITVYFNTGHVESWVQRYPHRDIWSEY